MEVFQKNEEKRQEREEQLLQEKQEQEKVINDENTPISQKEKAEKEIEEINKELNEVEYERGIEVEGLSLRDRLREKGKAIFKKWRYGDCHLSGRGRNNRGGYWGNYQRLEKTRNRFGKWA